MFKFEHGNFVRNFSKVILRNFASGTCQPVISQTRLLDFSEFSEVVICKDMIKGGIVDRYIKYFPHALPKVRNYAKNSVTSCHRCMLTQLLDTVSYLQRNLSVGSSLKLDDCDFRTLVVKWLSLLAAAYQLSRLFIRFCVLICQCPP